jgi:hypothetical protein
MGCVLRALRTSKSAMQAVCLAVAAGLAATAAVLVKQNFVDAFVFSGVLVAVGLVTRHGRLIQRPRRVAITAASFLGGAAIGTVCAIVWSTTHGGPGPLAFAMFGFRSQATSVMEHWSWAAPESRLEQLVAIGFLSGTLLLLGQLALRHTRRLRRLDALPWALATTAAVELAGVLGGANFWVHYLIAFVPTVSLTAGLAAHRRMPGARATRQLVVVAVVMTAVISPVFAARAAHQERASYTTGRWVGASAAPSDTLVVTYTHSNVINASGLRPGYPYAWSLPTRTLDPHLDLLVSRLDERSVTTPKGPGSTAAPTWLVKWDPPNTWGLDPAGRLDGALRSHYHRVASICGHGVWLHDGVSRRLAPLPSPRGC